MRKILIFSYQLLGTGGTESVLNAWTKNLEYSNKNYHIDLLIYGKKPDFSFLTNKKISIIPVEKTIYGKFLVIKKIRKIISHGHYNILICLGLKFLIAINYAMLFMIKKKPKVIYWNHFRIESNEFSKKTYRILKKTDMIFSLCESMTNQFINLGIKKEKISTIYNPIERADAKKRSNSGKHFFYVGRLNESQKRISDIIRTFYILKNEGFNDYFLEILGVGESIYYYVDMIKRFRLQHQVKIHDLWLKNPWEFIEKIDCLILSSNFEGFGLVLCEAISRGIPVISSNCPVGPSDIIQHGINGYLYEIGDIMSLKKYIKKIAEHKLLNATIISSSIEKMYVENYFKKIYLILENL